MKNQHNLKTKIIQIIIQTHRKDSERLILKKPSAFKENGEIHGRQSS